METYTLPRVNKIVSGNVLYDAGSSDWLALFSCSVESDSFKPIDYSTPGFPVLQYLRVCSDSCPLNQWCHSTISSSVVCFSFCPQSFPASGSFLMSQLFASGGQSIGTSVSASVLPINIQGWFPLGLTGLMSLPSKGLSGVFSSTIIWKHQFFGTQRSYGPTLISAHGYWKKTIAMTRQTFVGKVMSLLFNMLSRFVIAFLPRSKHLLIARLQSLSAMILEPKKIKSVTVFIFASSICHEVKGPEAMILVFWMLNFKPALSLFSFTFIKRLFSSSSLSAIRVLSTVYLRLLIFPPTILIPAWFHPVWHFAWCTLHISEISRVMIYSLDVLLS